MESHQIHSDRINETHYGIGYLVVPCFEKQYNIEKQQFNRRSEIFITEKEGSSWTDLNNYAVKPIIYSPLTLNDKISKTFNFNWTILFDFNCTKFKAESFVILDSIKEKLVSRKTEDATVTLTGYCDKNEELSNQLQIAKKRVEFVLAYLESRNVVIINPKLEYYIQTFSGVESNGKSDWMNRKVNVSIVYHLP